MRSDGKEKLLNMHLLTLTLCLSCIVLYLSLSLHRSWVVPAFGGSTMPIWHHEMRDFYVEPQYDYQAEIFAVRKECTIAEEELLVVRRGWRCL